MDNPVSHSEARRLYQKYGGDLRKVAREMGVKAHELTRALTSAVTRSEYVDDSPQPEMDRRGFPVLGPEGLRPFIVSRRHATGQWPSADRKLLLAARQKYDDGTHIMVQGRDGCWIIQYLWARQRPIAPPNWFFGQVD